MKPSQILSLYNGEYSFVDNSRPNSHRYHKVVSKSSALQAELKSLVDKNIYDLIDKELEYQNEIASIEMEYAYVGGFSFAISLFLEAIANG